MGATNNAPQQNQAAQQQIQQAYAQAMAHLQQWMQANPFPLNNITPPKGGPQFGGMSGGQTFGGKTGAPKK